MCVGVKVGVDEWGALRNVKRFRGGLAFKAHRLLCRSTLGSRVMNNKKGSASPSHDRLPKGYVDGLVGESTSAKRLEKHCV